MKSGCTAQTLRNWVRRAERDEGLRPGLRTDERAPMKALERENRELRQANEILRKTSAYFAQAELDRWRWRRTFAGSGTRAGRCTASGRSGSSCCAKAGRWHDARRNG